MPDLMAFLPKDLTLGSVSGWLLVLIAALYFFREYRETRKLSTEDRLALREGYAHEVEELRGENRLLTDDLRKQREELDNHRRLCIAETDSLRKDLIRKEEEIAGLTRQHAVLSLEIAKLKGLV